MNTSYGNPATIAQPLSQQLSLSGCWTAHGIDPVEPRLKGVHVPTHARMIVDGNRIEALDT